MLEAVSADEHGVAPRRRSAASARRSTSGASGRVRAPGCSCWRGVRVVHADERHSIDVSSASSGRKATTSSRGVWSAGKSRHPHIERGQEVAALVVGLWVSILARTVSSQSCSWRSCFCDTCQSPRLRVQRLAFGASSSRRRCGHRLEVGPGRTPARRGRRGWARARVRLSRLRVVSAIQAVNRRAVDQRSDRYSSSRSDFALPTTPSRMMRARTLAARDGIVEGMRAAQGAKACNRGVRAGR